MKNEPKGASKVAKKAFLKNCNLRLDTLFYMLSSYGANVRGTIGATYFTTKHGWPFLFSHYNNASLGITLL
jgi:Na+/melibiose symporter-like transporter